jgi:hypothetical protein
MQVISKDFIVDLPRTQRGFDSVFVVIDRIIKVAQFMSTMKISIASGVAKLFVKEKFVNYG